MTKTAILTLQRFLLKNTLPKYIDILRNHPQYYPVITGGMAALECIRRTGNTRLLRHIVSQDIDIHIVIPDDSETTINDAIKKRDMMMNMIMNDTELKESIAVAIPGGTLEMDTRMLALPPDHEAFHSMVLRMRLRLKSGKSYIVIDSGLYSPKSKAMYMEYRKYFGVPVPVVMHGRLPYASCEYVYYDTVRMLGYYTHVLFSVRDKRAQNGFAALKFANLLLKFVSLEESLHKLDNDDLVKVYIETKDIVKHLDHKQLVRIYDKDIAKVLKKVLAFVKTKTDLDRVCMGRANVFRFHKEHAST